MGYLKKRRFAAIIRYFRNNKEDQEKHIKTTMLLFYPFRNEQTEVHRNRNILKKYDEVKDEVETELALFELDP